ncbi:MAG: type IV pilus secretin PilQ [Thermodesulfobacteriota bacterium]
MFVAGVLVCAISLLFSAGCAKKAEQKMEAPAPTPQAARSVTGIDVAAVPEGAKITIFGDGLLTYTAVPSPFSQGMIVYLPGAMLAPGVPTELTPAGNALVQKVTVSSSAGDSPNSRIEIGLTKKADMEVKQEGDKLLVMLAAPEQASAPQPEVTETIVAVEQSTGIPPVDPSAAAEARLAKYADKGAKASASGRNRLTQIDFIQEAAGKSTIRVVTGKPVDFKLEKSGAKLLTLLLPGVAIPKEQARPLITTRFDSAADRIMPYQKSPQAAAVSIELRELVPYRIESDGSTINLHLDASTIPPRPLAEAALPPWEAVVTGEAPSEAAGAAAPAKEVTALEVIEMGTEAAGFEPTKFTGEKIALDFYKTDIKNVFRILKEVSGLNFAIDADVAGEVTLALDKPVPWDQVLYLVLKMNNLGAVRMGDIVRIAPLSKLDEEKKLATDRIDAEAKKRAAEENKRLVEELATKAKEPTRLEYIPINYAKCAELAAHLDSIMEEAQSISADQGQITTTQAKRFANIRCDERTNTILIIDTDKDIEDARKMIVKLDKPTPQVLIEARIVEATTSFSRDIGINWSGSGGFWPGDASYGTGPQRGYDALGGTYGYNWAINFPNVPTTNTIGFNFARVMGSPLVIDASLAALESRGSAKIVSAPKVLTLDNKKALIKQGIQYPIRKLDDAGNTTIEYHDVDLLLEVTPHITSDRRVSLTIKATKNDLGEVYAGEQSFTTKEAETELLLNDGNTVVIGGVIKTTKRDTVQGLPWLSRIPVLGWLFKSDSSVDNREELLVFITPRIMDLEE